MIRQLALSIALLLLPCIASSAQAPAQVEIIFPQDMGRTGVFRLSGEEPELQVQVRTVNAQGRPTRPPACVPTWKSASPEVLTVLRSSDREGAYVRPRAEGLTELTVTYPCAPTLSRRVAVVVGTAAIDKPFAASGTEVSYYPARLQLTPPGNSPVSGGRLYLLPDDQGTQFIASAYDGKGGRITPAEFPMKWSIKNPEVLTVAKQYDYSVFLNPVGNGTTTVTFTVEGLSQSFDITVDDAGPPSREDAASLVVRNLARASVRPVSTAARVATGRSTTGTTPVPDRSLTSPVLSITGTAIQLLSRSITTAPVAIVGTAIQLLQRSITTPPVAIVGTAIQLLQRSITTPPLVIQGR